jgi:hypothetical protein
MGLRGEIGREMQQPRYDVAVQKQLRRQSGERLQNESMRQSGPVQAIGDPADIVLVRKAGGRRRPKQHLISCCDRRQ